MKKVRAQKEKKSKWLAFFSDPQELLKVVLGAVIRAVVSHWLNRP
ncbi:hypothetical protein [Hymenobacter citatus]|nr:hypothetical protein [Hymenobacter citatus]